MAAPADGSTVDDYYHSSVDIATNYINRRYDSQGEVALPGEKQLTYWAKCEAILYEDSAVGTVRIDETRWPDSARPHNFTLTFRRIPARNGGFKDERFVRWVRDENVKVPQSNKYSNRKKTYKFNIGMTKKGNMQNIYIQRVAPAAMRHKPQRAEHIRIWNTTDAQRLYDDILLGKNDILPCPPRIRRELKLWATIRVENYHKPLDPTAESPLERIVSVSAERVDGDIQAGGQDGSANENNGEIDRFISAAYKESLQDFDNEGRLSMQIRRDPGIMDKAGWVVAPPGPVKYCLCRRYRSQTKSGSRRELLVGDAGAETIDDSEVEDNGAEDESTEKGGKTIKASVAKSKSNGGTEKMPNWVEEEELYADRESEVEDDAVCYLWDLRADQWYLVMQRKVNLSLHARQHMAMKFPVEGERQSWIFTRFEEKSESAVGVSVVLRTDRQDNITDHVAVKRLTRMDNELKNDSKGFSLEPRELYLCRRLMRLESRSNFVELRHDSYHHSSRTPYSLYFELAPYGDLSRHMTTPRRRLPELFLWTVFKGITDTCYYMQHDSGLDKGEAYVHIDVKPENVFLFQTPQSSRGPYAAHAKLGDYGLYCHLNRERLEYQVGTEGSRAPEQLIDDDQVKVAEDGQRPKAISTDVFGIGMIMYRAMYRCSDSTEQVTDPPGPFGGCGARGKRDEECAQTYSYGLHQLVEGCLHREQNKRYTIARLKELVDQGIQAYDEYHGRLLQQDRQAASASLPDFMRVAFWDSPYLLGRKFRRAEAEEEVEDDDDDEQTDETEEEPDDEHDEQTDKTDGLNTSRS
ncbi:kinase-like protein [Westerdykella ornata]|uniref:non-specific serine/threonine protein kinase n=1 Tax=Westerdykella ornata TaxID=318751 RepID=A0A6A6JA27_WESOR|nr:kinase-like protein [Westerdykella ornata]KAF2273450.1 kinase-like protein [Westerdykella ornata]